MEHEADVLTHTDAGTPCGDLIRRYWQPAALSEELPAGGAPVPVRLLGEELVVFRDDQGRPGLLGIHCSHRGADLSYGRVEDGGLRCIYHGWLYDIHGNCLDQPGEPGGGEHKASIRHPAYPCVERAGVIFAYLGPGEPPLLPNYEFLTVPGSHVFSIKLLNDSNYLQGNEGNIDSVHLSFLHRRINAGDLTERDLVPKVEVEVVDFGVRICTLRNAGTDQTYLRVSNFVYPNLSTFPGGISRDGYSVNWHVPIDDTHHWKYTFTFDRTKPLDKEVARRGRSEMTPDYKSIRNKANRYLQDRESMVDKSYTGIGMVFQAHDLCVVEGAGQIEDRTKEHLISSDKAILAARKLLLNAIKDVQEGREAPHVFRDPKANRISQLITRGEVIPSSTDWKEYVAGLERCP